MNPFSIFFRYLPALIFLISIAPADAQVVWKNDWTYAAPPWLNFQTIPKVRASAGDVVTAAQSYSGLDLQVSRFSAAGELRWTTNIGTAYFFGSRIDELLAEDSGGAIVAGDEIAKIDATGAISWMRSVPSTFLKKSQAGSYTAVGCIAIASGESEIVVSNLNGATGAIAWQTAMGVSPGDSCPLDLFDDGAGNIYFATSLMLQKIGHGGAPGWHVPLDNAGSILGADANRVYVALSSTVIAVSAGTGSTLWSSVCSCSGTVVGTPAEVIIDTPTNTIQRLAAADGHVLWTANVEGAEALSAVSDSIIVRDASSNLVRVDANSGAIVWSKNISSLSNAPAATLDTNTLLVVNNIGYPPSIFQPVAYSSGALGKPIAAPSVTQGIYAQKSFADNAEYSLDVAYEYDTSSNTNVRVRRVKSSDGTVQWESNASLGFVGQQPAIYTSVGAAAGGDVVAVISATSQSVQNSDGWMPIGQVSIAAFDRSTGMLRWTKQLWRPPSEIPFQGYTSAKIPQVDNAGNVYLGIGTTIDTPNAGYITSLARQSVYKLASADGHVLWEQDADEGYAPPDYFVNAPAIQLVGSDVLATGPFQSSSDATLVRLSGVDGTNLWSSNTLPAYYWNDIYPSDQEWSFYPIGDKFIVAGQSYWGKLDPESGVFAWSFNIPPDPNCANFLQCVSTNGAVDSVGDVISGGFDYNNSAYARRLRGDGSGQVDSWHLETPDAAMLSSVAQTLVDSSDKIFFLVHRELKASADSVTFLSGFDVATNLLKSQQVIGAGGVDELLPSEYPSMISPPTDGRVLISGIGKNGTTPATSFDALLDTSVAALGDLLAQTTMNATHVRVGDNPTFHFVATYSGDAAVTGVQLYGSLPWSSDLSNVVCTASSAANCVLDTRSGNVHASFDIQPGGQVDISGQVTVRESEGFDVAAQTIVYGPMSLSETNTQNNFSSAVVHQSLFYDGFDGH